MPESQKKSLRTVDVRPDDFSLIKPGELIDVVEMSPLTLHDRRVYNLLLLNAWENLGEPVEHSIHKRELRGSHDVNDRVGESIDPKSGSWLGCPLCDAGWNNRRLRFRRG